MAANSISMDIS